MSRVDAAFLSLHNEEQLRLNCRKISNFFTNSTKNSRTRTAIFYTNLDNPKQKLYDAHTLCVYSTKITTQFLANICESSVNDKREHTQKKKIKNFTTMNHFIREILSF